jgi:type I restriction enzyme, S subunit
VTPHDLIAAFDTLADAPKGVKRLRELVLQLAVRGNLVPQDPDDEPASVLLERIAVEKARLVKEKKIRKPKVLPPVSKDEVPFEVPDGWAWAQAEQLLQFVTSGSRGWAKYYSDSGPIFLRIGNLDYGTTKLDLAKIQRVTPPEGAEGSRTSVEARDFLISITGDTGMVGLVPADLGEGYINQHIALCRPLSGVWPAYVAMTCTSLFVRDQLWGLQRGIKNSLGLNDIRWLRIPLPPLPEQKRIVARVDELMGLLDRLEAARNAREATRTAMRDAALAALRDADTADEVEIAWERIAGRMDDLFTDPADVDPLRQTVLQLAVRGRLVPQDPDDEPASVLLKRAKVERAELEQMKRIRRRKHPGVRIRREWEPPVEWADACVYDIAYSYDHLRVPVSKAKRAQRLGEVPYYGANGQVGWIDEALFDESLVLVVEDETFIGRTKPFSYLIEGRTWVNNHAHVLRPSVAVAPPYLNLMLMFYPFIDATSGTTNRRKLTQPVLLGAQVGVPPMAEQERIVAKVDELMGLLDRLASRLADKTTAHDAFAAAAVHHLDA